MSTKIYGAFEFTGSLEELLKFCKSLRLRWTEYFLDERFFPIVDVSKNNVDEVFSSVKEQTNKKSNSFLDVLDFKASVMVFTSQDRLFVKFFVDDLFTKIIKNILSNDPRFKDYHYQNQTDPWFAFEDYSEEEMQQFQRDWEEREMIWDKIFSDTVEYEEKNPVALMFGRMSDAGFTYELGSPDDLSALECVIYGRLS